MKNTYYTYAWLREDMTPYYVGKGTNNRAYRPHRRGDAYMSPPPRDRVLFLKKNLTEFDAYKHENYIITILGLKSEGGILINMSYGGEGSFTTVDRINYNNDFATASVRGLLSSARYNMGVTGNSDYGWFGCGATPTSVSTVDRINFSNDGITALVRGPLSSARYTLAATSNTPVG